jgi:hypothetical protein
MVQNNALRGFSFDVDNIFVRFKRNSDNFLHLMDLNDEYRDQVTGWATGVQFPAEAMHFFSSLPLPDPLWGPKSLLSIGYRGYFP